jgi:hypothetical protein
MQVTIRLGQGEPEQPEKPQVRTTKRDERRAVGTIHNGPVTFHSFYPKVSVPVTQIPTWSMMKRILSEGKETIISPEGYLLADSYGRLQKPEDTKRSGHSTTRRGITYEHTEAGIERDWMMRQKAFQRELEEQGWFIIPAITHLTNDEKERQGLSEYSTYCQRPVKLSELQKILQLTAASDNAGLKLTSKVPDSERYALALNDLQELTRYMDDVTLVYESGDRMWPLHMLNGTAEIKTGGRGRTRTAHVELTKLDDNWVKPNTEEEASDWRCSGEKANTVVRTAKVSAYIREDGRDYSTSELPHWWSPDHTGRVLTLGNEYVKQQGLEHLTIEHNDNENTKFTVEAANRCHYHPDKQVKKPSTRQLVLGALGVKDFLTKAIALEYAANNQAYGQELHARRDALMPSK